jgi:four helix bundle protein
MKVERFEDLIAWQKARCLTRNIYMKTLEGRFARDYALCQQIRKSAISVPSNIAEGFERGRRAEFHQFLSIAKGSCAELRTQLYIAHDVGYIDEETLQKLLSDAEEVTRIVAGLRTSVARQQTKSQVLSPKS